MTKSDNGDNVRHKTFDSSGMRSFVAGLSAGMASTVAGYVPDTIKVRLQTQPLTEPVRYKGALDCGIRMVREEGVRSLFRGMSTPLMSRAIVNGMCFSTYTLLIKGLYPPAHDGRAYKPPIPAAFFAGGCAGAASALVASPTELIKVQMQLGIVVGGPFHHMKVLIDHSGVRGLLMLGMLPTILRDFVCMGTFFATTSEFSRAMATRYPNSPVSHVAALLGGAMAGVAGWALCYPFDVWKSNVQQIFGVPKNQTNQNALSFVNFFSERYKARGIRGFYSGLGPTLFRAIPVNATKFFAFDLVIRIFQRTDM
eukprot:Phypoly_transcript_09838.p1 GENE.Phypoly_transcript_09838~~Phypoly_transcript_09838.p1  ORF type:complete len:311 (+),score=22.51 Phypoly_transcript_09838:95-1027(+)